MSWLGCVAVPRAVLLVFLRAAERAAALVSFLKSEAQQLTGELTLDNYGFLFTRPLYSRRTRAHLRRRRRASACSTSCSAYPLAYFLVRTTSRWKGLLIALSLAPLLASVVVRTYGWYIILNRFGVANDVLLALGLIAERIAFMPSTGAITIGLAHALLPYARADDHGVARRHPPQSRARGDEPGRQPAADLPLSVVLPLSMPGVVGGFILCFSIAISAYATPAILGGPATQVMATAIYGFMTQLLDWSIGAALAVILVVSSLAAALPRVTASAPRQVSL